jgi:four helix bundle protein
MVSGNGRAELMSRSSIRCFEDLRVWHKGIAFVKHLYEVTAGGNLGKDFALRDQLRRAGISIPGNIAEGFERASRKEYLQFLNVAKGSAGEVRCLLRVGLEVGTLQRSRLQRIEKCSNGVECVRCESDQITQESGLT